MAKQPPRIVDFKTRRPVTLRPRSKRIEATPRLPWEALLPVLRVSHPDGYDSVRSLAMTFLHGAARSSEEVMRVAKGEVSVATFMRNHREWDGYAS